MIIKTSRGGIRSVLAIIFTMFLLSNNAFWGYNNIVRCVLLFPYLIYTLRFIFFIDMILMLPFTKTFRIVKISGEFTDLELLDVFSILGAKMVLVEVSNSSETFLVSKFTLRDKIKVRKYCVCYKPLNGETYHVLDWGIFFSSFLNLMILYWILKIPLMFPELSK